MENRETSIAEHLANDFANINDTNYYGFFDWFCKDSSLKNKSKGLISRLKGIVKVNNGKFDPTKTYVFFKNNCPGYGPFYDDFRICDIESGDVLYTVIPKSSHSGKAEVWGIDNDFDEPIVKGTWKEIKQFFAA